VIPIQSWGGTYMSPATKIRVKNLWVQSRSPLLFNSAWTLYNLHIFKRAGLGWPRLSHLRLIRVAFSLYTRSHNRNCVQRGTNFPIFTFSCPCPCYVRVRVCLGASVNIHVHVHVHVLSVSVSACSCPCITSRSTWSWTWTLTQTCTLGCSDFKNWSPFT
jgi:hypothetical protein